MKLGLNENNELVRIFADPPAGTVIPSCPDCSKVGTLRMTVTELIYVPVLHYAAGAALVDVRKSGPVPFDGWDADDSAAVDWYRDEADHEQGSTSVRCVDCGWFEDA